MVDRIEKYLIETLEERRLMGSFDFSDCTKCKHARND